MPALLDAAHIRHAHLPPPLDAAHGDAYGHPGGRLMADKYGHVVKAIQESAWAILPAKMDAIVEVVRLRAAGGQFTEDEIRERIGAQAARAAAPLAGAVAVIPILGVIGHRMNMFSSISGGTSAEALTAQVRQALDDASVRAIVFDIDSPGGSVEGIQELGEVIFAARGRKRMVAVSNALCASAAYWLGCQADELVVTPSGQVGSIGVLAVHQDLTKQAEMVGVKVEYISAGAYKTEGQPFEPLTDAAREAMQARVDEYYDAFVQAVARGRRVMSDEVRKGFGQGRVMSAQGALSAGMVDRVETLEATIQRLNASSTAPAPRAVTPGRTTPMITALPLPVVGESEDDFKARCAVLGASAPAVQAQWDAAQALAVDAAARATAGDGDIALGRDQLAALQRRAARGDQLTSVEERLRLSEQEKAELAESTRQDRIAAKVRGLKIPAFRPFARVFLALATSAPDGATFVLTDPKHPVTAEQAVDALIAEMNRHAQTIFTMHSVAQAPADMNEPDLPGERVDYRAKKYIAERKLDPVKDYATAKAAVLDADPELKEAYARS